MSEIQPAKKKRYTDPWGSIGDSDDNSLEACNLPDEYRKTHPQCFQLKPEIPKKKDLEKMQKKKYFEDLYFEFRTHFEEN